MSCLLPLAVRVLGSRVFDVGWCVDSSFCLLFQGLCFNACNSWAELNTTCLPGVPKRPPPKSHATQPAASDLCDSKIHQEIHRQIQNGWIHRLADFTPGPRWASGPFPGWMAATLTHLNAFNGWSNAPNPRPFRRRRISFVVQTRTTPISVTAALIGTGDTNHS